MKIPTQLKGLPIKIVLLPLYSVSRSASIENAIQSLMVLLTSIIRPHSRPNEMLSQKCV
jgi:hypothetical protein